MLDTGVDPAAAGLTSRVVDLIDASGSGDVKLQQATPLESAGEPNQIRIKSPSGRILLASSNWSNPSGVWRVGRSCFIHCVDDVAHQVLDNRQATKELMKSGRKI